MDKKLPVILTVIFLLLLVTMSINPYFYLVVWVIIFFTAIITLFSVDMYFSRRSPRKKPEEDLNWDETLWINEVWSKKRSQKKVEELVWDESFWDKNVWKELEKYERSRKWYNRIGLGLVWEKVRRLTKDDEP